ncbi:tyrosine-protein phosphatase [Oenococcus kitaharae]|uniref:Protein tyrosine/serine phosphatase n=1 Tax=Oenococcus kitaharae DSM 17330 TaxID=1045004 RepID=G9WET7_9LACO|nr:tyrosine-protein phosphatase [Oenococcus kitaharae]EHN58260.1 Protein tyrosine/serine phosphatase [Oenococcus kitaharae DSM 17330]OEY81561.1 protein tyrosine phosphatase [Oenococcus kitaharae]OEY83047.1 protein tyrosine phosphatase [Oenococcus kitaharae]OEY84407.1 protein tyrosine phosphatase [Oenococcus kitaharae]
MFEKRILNIKGGRNFRDLGGYSTIDNRQVRWGRLFRGAKMADFSARDLKVLKHHKIARVIDFRSLDERLNDPDAYSDSIEEIELPLLNEDTTNSTADANDFRHEPHEFGFAYERMMATYRNMVVDEFSQQTLQVFFRYLLDGSQGALLFHCTKGKDRTGLASALFLSAVGVDKETVFRDYALSDQFNQPENEAHLTKMIQQGASDADIDNAKHFIMTDPDYLANAFAAMSEVAGSPQAYLTQIIGLDQDSLAELKQRYLR